VICIDFLIYIVLKIKPKWHSDNRYATTFLSQRKSSPNDKKIQNTQKTVKKYGKNLHIAKLHFDNT